MHAWAGLLACMLGRACLLACMLGLACLLAWTLVLAPCFFFSPFLWVLSFYKVWQSFIILVHVFLVKELFITIFGMYIVTHIA
jgi:hypothetical protein